MISRIDYDNNNCIWILFMIIQNYLWNCDHKDYLLFTYPFYDTEKSLNKHERWGVKKCHLWGRTNYFCVAILQTSPAHKNKTNRLCRPRQCNNTIYVTYNYFKLILTEIFFLKKSRRKEGVFLWFFVFRRKLGV